MNTKIIFHRRSPPRPIIKIIRYCPQLTLSKLFGSPPRQSVPIYPLAHSNIYSSFVVSGSPASKMRRCNDIYNFADISADRLQSVTPQQLLKSASPTERKLSLLSFQRTTVCMETPAKQQESLYQIEYDDDTVYYGEIKVTKRHGLGSLYNSKKELIYQGQWKDDKYHGIGILYSNGKVYKGEFVHGSLNGQGIEEGEDSKFYGYFSNGSKNGPGTYYEKSKPTQGIWKDDKMLLEC